MYSIASLRAIDQFLGEHFTKNMYLRRARTTIKQGEAKPRPATLLPRAHALLF